jgi:hypothetical protein
MLAAEIRPRKRYVHFPTKIPGSRRVGEGAEVASRKKFWEIPKMDELFLAFWR